MDLRDNTTLLYRPAPSGGRHKLANPAIERASTVLFDDLDAFDAAAGRRLDTPYYGRYGTTTIFELEALVAQLERADKSYGMASGHAAISTVLLAFLSPGDHALFPENAYEPTKHIATGLLRRYGVECDFYPGRIGRAIESFCKPTTKLIWIEAPGSVTYEIPSIDEIVAHAQARGILTVADNTWGSSWLFKPLEYSVDVSVVSATKYMSGHSDAVGGFISIHNCHRKLIEAGIVSLGAALSPDSAYLIQRGLRTMPARLARQAATAMQVALSLSTIDSISVIFFPPCPWAPDHDRWKRYFSGGNGLLTFALDGVLDKSSPGL